MPVRLRYHTDPACPESWAAEPVLRRLFVEFGADLSITYVMGGLAREYEEPYESRVMEWLDHADRSGMPFDPRLWTEAPIRSTYPACMAVKAAAEQGPEAAGRYLRVLREGLMCLRRKLDAKEALVEEARGAGLDAGRFRIDLESNAIVEAFGADLEATRTHARELPFFVVGGGEAVCGPGDDLRAALVQAGAHPAGEPSPDVLAALARFGRMASAEVEAVCDLPGPRAHAELWRLAAEWRVRPVRVLTGFLWEAA
ncbi:MAG TPA: DsbA family protein [Thermoleophilaceae bacterium]|nr:DsbA family protein [Thermoleophilaceae bacterium]